MVEELQEFLPGEFLRWEARRVLARTSTPFVMVPGVVPSAFGRTHFPQTTNSEPHRGGPLCSIAAAYDAQRKAEVAHCDD